MLVSAHETDIHATTDARIVRSNLFDGKFVVKGEVLVELELPDLAGREAQARAKLNLANASLLRLTADSQSRSNRQILEEQQLRATKELDSLREIAKAAIIRAPFDGEIANVDPDLRSDRWIGPHTRLAIVIEQSSAKAIAFTDDVALARIRPSATAIFVPDDRAFAKVPLHLSQTAANPQRELAIPELADVNGGTIITAAGANGQPVALRQQTRIDLLPQTTLPAPGHALRGVVIIDAMPQSLAGQAARRVAKVLIEESAF